MMRRPRVLFVIAAWLGLGAYCAAGPALDSANVRDAITDLMAAYPESYTRGAEFLARLDALGSDAAPELEALAREALLANPLLDFKRLLLIKRAKGQLGLPQNWESNSTLPARGFDNEIAVVEDLRAGGEPVTLFRPDRDVFVGDVDLDFDASRMLFSMPEPGSRWRIFEMNVDGTGLSELPLIPESDVDNYDACYLPDGNIIFTSTAPFVGVPCVTGSSHVSNLFFWKRDDGGIRRLSFEQDHDWCPTIMNDGRIMYLRWEYSDLPHFASRILFSMNPDGTTQMAHYGSNSYWPNSLFYARPVPGHPTLFAGIVGGHHDVPRMGELVLFDAARGRFEADGAVQRIPGRGKQVEPIIRDRLVADSWPKFLHPYPLSDKYLLVACKPTEESEWGIYLADVFDNLVLIKETPGYALFEPLPLCPRPLPPQVPASARNPQAVAQVYMQDVYAGPGLAGVPRGAVKNLRIFTYHFAYHGVGGQINRVGLDGPWDIKRVIGTVPVEEDGSAYFAVPANTPISIQPLDERGQALQLMRSWMTAMPGETLACVGCHEPVNGAPPVRPALAARRAPSEIASWYGAERGFSFVREVQPVLDRHCVSCHDGAKAAPDLRDAPPVNPPAPSDAYRLGTKFPPAYLALRRYVRTPTMESDMHLLPPADFRADTTALVRLLDKGHHRVRLDKEAWDRLVTWIDLNAPAHGTWGEIVGVEKVAEQRDRRMIMLARYAGGASADPEEITLPTYPRDPVPTEEIVLATPAVIPEVIPAESGAPAEPAFPARRSVTLAEGVALDLCYLPPGDFVAGDDLGAGDEGPSQPKRVEAGFWMGVCEVTNAQYVCFDPKHDSRLENGDFLQFSVEQRGFPLNGPDQPVARVSWREAAAFCAWLSEKAGEPFTLPSEAQWEYACRAGTTTPMSYGDLATPFAEAANLGDARLFAVERFPDWGLPFDAIHSWRRCVESVNDGFRVSAPVMHYQPNAWGLYDLHGNVAEWTTGDYKTVGPMGRTKPEARRAVRGGSWYDQPADARAAARRGYPEWQRVFDVGFRVVCLSGPEPARMASSSTAHPAAD